MKITNRHKWMALGGLLLFAAGFAFRGCFRPEYAEHEDGFVSGGGTGQVQIYTCSMHPQIRSPDPKDKCPICAMDLIPVPSDGDEPDDERERPRLRLSDGAAALMEIRTYPVERRPLEMELRLFGKIGFDESRLFDVVARTEGYVEGLTANTPWQPVEKGERLAELYSPSTAAALREMLAVRGGAGVLNSARARLLRMGVAEEQIEEVLQTGEVPRTFRIVSPASGFVVPPVLREGESLREGDRLVRIADLSQVWVNLEAYERDLPHLRENTAVTFTVASYGERTFEGRVVFIDPVLNESSRTIRLRAEAENSEGLLKPGMFVNAQIRVPHAENRLVIPVSAPLITGKRALVYVRDPAAERPTFEARQVLLGPRAGEVYVVEEGLDEGDLVVVNGQFKIDSELQIRGRPSMMSAKAPDSAEPRLQTHCPVMDGAIDRSFYHDHAGQRIYVCCPGCLDEVRARADEIIREQREKGIIFEKSPEAGE